MSDVTEKKVEEFLEHYGVKGMKWGQRKQARLERAQRVASGKGSFGDRIIYKNTESKFALTRKQQEKEAAKTVEKLKRIKKNIERGEASVKDFLDLYGMYSFKAIATGAIVVMSDDNTPFLTMQNIDDAAIDEYLEHWGVKGMKWGVRRALKNLPPSERGSYLKEKDAKWLAKVEANPKLAKVSKLTTRYAKREMKKLKKDYKERGMNIKKSSLARMRYDNEVKVILDQSLEKATYKAHKLSPSRLNEVQIQRHPDGTMTARVVARDNPKIAKQFKSINKADVRRQNSAAKIAKKAAAASLKQDALGHAEDPTEEEFEGLEFFLILDDEGFVDDILSPFGPDDLEQEAMSDDEYLQHWGVKGMKWGQRKDVPPSIRKLKNKDVPGHTREQVRTARNRMGEEAVIMFNEKSLPKINEKWSKVDLSDPKNMRGYQVEMAEKMRQHLDDAVVGYGDKFFENVHFRATFNGAVMQIHIVDDDVKHADDSPFLVFEAITDSNGRVIELVMKDIELEHSDKVGEFLEHWGVKGMKWGVRKKRSNAPRHSDEGAQARKILAKQKNYGTGSLTNHELRVVNARIKLEQEFHKLNPKPKTKLQRGIEIVDKLSKAYDAVEKMDRVFKGTAGKAKIAKGKAMMEATPSSP